MEPTSGAALQGTGLLRLELRLQVPREGTTPQMQSALAARGSPEPCLFNLPPTHPMRIPALSFLQAACITAAYKQVQLFMPKATT